MKKIFYFVAASLLMTSCLEDRAIEAYNEDFVEVFGETDPNHTWKMVENQSVEVNLDKPSRVKIYVKAGNAYRLAADYENVSGTQSLSYDAPMGCEDIHVTVDGVPYQRGYSRTEDGAQVGVFLTDEYESFTYQTIQGYYDNFRLDGNLLPETEDNTDNVTFVDNQFISNGGIYKFYPLYWGGEFHHSYGLYYYDENGIKVDCPPFISDHKDKTKDGILKRLINTETEEWEFVYDNYAYNYFFTGSKSYIPTEEILRSRCYKIQLPINTVFGFYVDVIQKKEDEPDNNRGRFYSDPALNKNSSISTFAYYYKNNTTSYITVEDLYDKDYNDFIFVLEGTPTPVVKDPIKYIYAVEDLGGTNDFDFNDIVFSVSHINGQPNATVQPLAAGGIYPAQIYFKGEACGEEIHSMFGKASNVMINTQAGTNKYSMLQSDDFEVPVGINWSQTATKYGESGNGFSVSVEIPDRVDKEVFTCDPGEQAAPQMLVLSEDWLWPTETTRISDAYTGFQYWGLNYTDKTWAKTYDPTLVVNWLE